MRPDFKALRLRLGLNYREAVALFRCSPRAWYYWEAGTRAPAPGPAVVLLEVLGQFPDVAAWLLCKLKGEQKVSDYPANGFRVRTEQGRVYLQINDTEYGLSIDEALAISDMLRESLAEARWEEVGIADAMRAAKAKREQP